MYLPDAFKQEPPSKQTNALPVKDQGPSLPKQLYIILFHNPALLTPCQHNPWVSSTSTIIISAHLTMNQANKAAKQHWETWPKAHTVGGDKQVTWQGGQAGIGAGTQNIYKTEQKPYRVWGWLHSEWQCYRIEVAETKFSVD